jgi:hypothetical protein
MNLSQNQLIFLLERQLERHYYRRYKGLIWGPMDVADRPEGDQVVADWPHEGAKCIIVARQLAQHDESGLLPARFAVSLCTHRVQDKYRFWVHDGRPIFDSLHSYEIAAIQAVAVAIDRLLPVCLDRPEVSHALGDVGIWEP